MGRAIIWPHCHPPAFLSCSLTYRLLRSKQNQFQGSYPCGTTLNSTSLTVLQYFEFPKKFFPSLRQWVGKEYNPLALLANPLVLGIQTGLSLHYTTYQFSGSHLDTWPDRSRHCESNVY